MNAVFVLLVLALPAIANADQFFDAESKTKIISEITNTSGGHGAAATYVNMYLALNCKKPVTVDMLKSALESDKYVELSRKLSVSNAIGLNGSKRLLNGLEKEVNCIN